MKSKLVIHENDPVKNTVIKAALNRYEDQLKQKNQANTDYTQFMINKTEQHDRNNRLKQDTTNKI